MSICSASAAWLSGSWLSSSARATADRMRHWALVRPMVWARWSTVRLRRRATSWTSKNKVLADESVVMATDIISKLIIGKLAKMSQAGDERFQAPAGGWNWRARRARGDGRGEWP